MSISKSCMQCNAVLDASSLISICPTCLKSTPGPDQGRTLDNVIADIAPTAPYVEDKSTDEYFSVDGEAPVIMAVRSPVPEFVDLTEWEKTKILELAARGYRVVRKLGEGGFGVVFQAVDAAERTVAVKVLRAELGQVRYRQRFALEANALTRLDHPGLVRLFHYDVSGPEPMLVTEYVPGGTLAQKLHGRLAFEPRVAADAVRQLATSVQLVHDAGLIHRDIKPSNILITADDRMKLGDFGLVKRLDRNDDLTPSGRGIGGTPEYSAPEQFRGSDDCDGRADIYALGATLYRLLTGQAVFERVGSDDLVGVILRVMADEVVPPRKLRPDIPRELEAVCLRCLEKNPADRYPTAAALAADLKAWETGGEMIARPRTLAGRVWKRARRVPKLPVAVVFVALLGLGAAFFILKDQAPPEEPLAAMKRELGKNGTVVLQGETGEPRWHRFPIGGSVLSRSLIGDKACSFESMNIGVLELYPEAPSDHFLFEGEVRFADSRIGNDPGEHPYLGLFVAGELTGDPKKDKSLLYTLTGLYFEEGPTVRDHNLMHFASARILQRSDVVSAKGKSGMAHTVFTPSATVPGPWRKFRIEVWPDRIIPKTVTGGAEQDFTVSVRGGTIDAMALGKALDRLEHEQRKNIGPDGLTYPKWNSRGAVGIWAYKAAVDFKNVSLVPLP